MINKLLVLDNYDSFTYNILYIIKILYPCFIAIHKNTDISLVEISAYKKILLSPGPGMPEESSILMSLIKYYTSVKNILGVCLGQQAIASIFGGRLINPYYISHGIYNKITIIDREEKVFYNLPIFLKVGRYNSWIISEYNFPLELKITARGPKGEIMALRHNFYDIVGIQFHPESMLTPKGASIIFKWLKS